MPDKSMAVWVSHTSISDFLRCPKAYYLKNVYKDPKTRHKIKIVSPSLALGSVVHEVLEALSNIPRDRRFDEPLISRLDRVWTKISGKKGGFPDDETEYAYKQRGQEMLRRVTNNPGPIAELSVKIQTDDPSFDLPNYYLSEKDNVILCGKIDWLQYLPETDSVHIIDFKTGRNEEEQESLQLPIYHLLVHNCQKRKATKASYWYLETSDTLTEKPLPDLEESHKKVLEIALQMKLARQLNRFKCPNGDKGCPACNPIQQIIEKKAELVDTDGRNDIYIPLKLEVDKDAIIL